MKPYILGLVFAVVVVLPPLAHADTVPIGDPYTDTTRLWSELAEALSSLANDVAAFFHNHHLATGVPAGSAVGESAAVATAVTSFAAAQESGTTPPVLPQSAATTTIVNNYITNPIERVIDEEPLASSDFVTQDELATALLAVSQKLAPEQTELLPQWVAADGNPSLPYAAVNNITNLSGVTISNATISGGSVPSSSLTGTIANAIDTATGEIDSLSGTDLTYTAATTTNATSTNLFASNIAASALSVAGTTTLENVILSSLNCSTFGNGGKLTTDAIGTVTCAADQGGSGSTVGGSDMEVQFNSGGSFQGSSSFTFASSTDRLTVTNASTTNVTASYASSTNLVVGNATSTNLFASLANLTTGIIGSLSGSQLTYTAASTTNLSNTGTAYFGGTATTTIDSAGDLSVAGNTTLQSATTTNLFAKSSLTASAASFGATATSSFNNAGQLTLANLASAVLGVNSSGQVVATTTIGTNLLTGTLGTINGASLSPGGTITITAASSTLLANNNTWTGLQQFANASSTLETDSTLWLPNTASALLKTTGSGQVAAAIAGTDYQVPITASYPISFSGNNLSLAFGTTTANTFSQLQTLSGGASTTNLSASGEGYFATASTTNLTVSGSPSGFLQTNAQGIVSATSTFSAGSIFGTFLVANGGTGSTTLTGILKGNGTGAIQTAVGGTDYEFPLTFSTGLNRTGNIITNTGVLLLGSGYATTTGTSITLSTTTQSFNGLTIAQQITSPNGSDLLFTPTISGTLSNAGLAHSTIILNGVTLTLGDTNDTVTAASSTLLANNNTWTGLQQFQNASTTVFSSYGPAYFGATATSTFTSGGALNLAGLGTFGSGFVSQASSTVVGNFTLTGTLQAQGSASIGTTLAVNGTTGTTTIASGQGFTVGGSQFVVQQGSGNVGIGTTNPSAAKLVVTGSAASSLASFTDNTDGTFSISTVGSGAGGVNLLTSAGYLNFNTDSPLTAMTILRNGNVGIGTTTPESNLSIVTGSNGGGVYLSGNAGASPDFQLQKQESGEADFAYVANAGDFVSGSAVGDVILEKETGTGNIDFVSDGAIRMAINPSGHVLINGTTDTTGRITDYYNGGSEWGINLYDTNGGTVRPVNISSNGTSVGSITNTNSATSFNTTSDRRLKENISTTTQGLATLMQIPVDNFDFINDPTHTNQQGFIAQNLYPIYPEAVTTNGDNGIVPLGATSTPWQVDYGRITPLILSAVQDIANISSTFEANLIAWLGNAQNGIGQFFAQVGNFQTTNATTSNASTTNTQTLNASTVCLTQSNGQQVCVTGDQLAALLSQTASAQTSESVSSSAIQNPTPEIPESVSSATSTGNAAAGDTPPVIQINGDNPAIIQVGTTYNDLGATITGPQADLNLGIQTFVNGAPVSPVQIDTRATATDTIDYVAIDQNGLTSTSTRTVLIEASSIVPSETASSTAATSTDATTTTQ